MYKVRRELVIVGGSATFGSDTNLYRSAANTLKTDDALTAVGVVTADGGINSAGTVTLTGRLVLPYSTSSPTMGANGQLNSYHKSNVPYLVVRSSGTVYTITLPTATGGTAFYTVGTAAV